jgi:hypothetical protein
MEQNFFHKIPEKLISSRKDNAFNYDTIMHFLLCSTFYSKTDVKMLDE